MELQSRPEALAVELARHQVGSRGPEARVGVSGTRAWRPVPLRGVCLTRGTWRRLLLEPAGGMGGISTSRTPLWAPLPSPLGSPSFPLLCNPAQFGAGGGGPWDLSPASFSTWGLQD